MRRIKQTKLHGPQYKRFPTVPTPPTKLPLKDPLAAMDIKMPQETEDDRVARWQEFRAKTQASYPEFLCWEWVVKKKALQPDIDFYFQYPFMGGRTAFGGFVLDFFFPNIGLAWFIQGLHFHFTKSTDRARDLMAVKLVSDRGIEVVQVFEDDIMNRLDFTLENAYMGRQVSRKML